MSIPTGYNLIHVAFRVKSVLGIVGRGSLRFKSDDFLIGQEVNIVSGVDGLWDTVNLVRNLTRNES
jgi:hypothetical protein